MNDARTATDIHPQPDRAKGSVREVLWTALRLGLTSFGGPVAHLGYFRDEYVERKKWLDERSYAELVALCQFLPGPASSQVGMGIGWMRAGFAGALAAWAGFTLPSALLLILFAYLVTDQQLADAGWIHGLKVVAVAVVAQAVWGMMRTLVPDRARGTVMVLAAVLILLWPFPYVQIAVIVLGALIGRMFLRSPEEENTSGISLNIGKRTAVSAWVLFFGLLLVLPVLRPFVSSAAYALFDSFYRTGSLVFGGGHVVLPLLQGEMVPTGWVTGDEFVAGYGAAQAVPGPLFTFSAYLGMMANTGLNGWIGAGIALAAIFLPSFLLLAGALPFWDKIRGRSGFKSALTGINAAVVGILLAALYDPVFTGTIRSASDFVLALAAFALLMLWKWPPWAVVLFCAAGGGVMHALV